MGDDLDGVSEVVDAGFVALAFEHVPVEDFVAELENCFEEEDRNRVSYLNRTCGDVN